MMPHLWGGERAVALALVLMPACMIVETRVDLISGLGWLTVVWRVTCVRRVVFGCPDKG